MTRRPPGSSLRGDGARRPRPSGRLSGEAETSARRPPPAAPEPPQAAPEGSGLVLLGEFGRAQGLAGEVRLKSYTADPKGIAGYGPLVATDGRLFEIASLRQAPGGAPDILVARVKGVASREAAEALNRIALHVHRERLGAPEDEDEFLATDLVGLAVFDPQGREIGRLRGVENYGGGDLLEIVPLAGGASALLPFTKAFVPSLDVAGGRITVDAPDDLFDPPGPRPKDEPA
ncbi:MULTISPECIES: ribosome maturation factor RimM [Methylobacterium]|uniref:Ribosome maturation factor RimM n=2 Tax=Methylobacterium TaxID=407 RepID=A0ABQ4SWR4_9HYPH|nr:MULTISPECIES: ribosome maturation factor RimM [Methylobacterium]PIU05181.1 MAG: ribosome maturation factor RimM [Methylobacterium sp. CG09_land_8_20_14_0_10_71_15]PIU15458.1 MAG: ribosome maturation factor RimM [Methylobacterium sp. CG08_land_8_20_14_0_20_71_15]GJE06338.1 Ribosome maturation factor RimM [Methylobacterium jeotgali]